jgi:hypothetical protein
VDIEWAAGRPKLVRIASEKGQPCRILCPNIEQATITRGDENITPKALASGQVEFPTEPGATYELTWR